MLLMILLNFLWLNEFSLNAWRDLEISWNTWGVNTVQLPYNGIKDDKLMYTEQQWKRQNIPDSKVHGANMGPIWGRQDPGGPHVGPMNFVIWDGSE